MKVVCISGKAQHGKDTTAGILREALEADGLTVLITHYGDLVKYVCKSFFKWDGQKDERGRTLLQFVGTDIVRAQRPDYWVGFVADMLTMFDGQWDYVLIPDCRFPNEIDVMKDAGFDVEHVRVRRKNFQSPLTLEQQNHPSEIALDDIKPDFYVDNDGTMEDLRKAVSELVTELNGFHQMSIGEL